VREKHENLINEKLANKQKMRKNWGWRTEQKVGFTCEPT